MGHDTTWLSAEGGCSGYASVGPCSASGTLYTTIAPSSTPWQARTDPRTRAQRWGRQGGVDGAEGAVGELLAAGMPAGKEVAGVGGVNAKILQQLWRRHGRRVYDTS